MIAKDTYTFKDMRYEKYIKQGLITQEDIESFDTVRTLVKSAIKTSKEKFSTIDNLFPKNKNDSTDNIKISEEEKNKMLDYFEKKYAENLKSMEEKNKESLTKKPIPKELSWKTDTELQNETESKKIEDEACLADKTSTFREDLSKKIKNEKYLQYKYHEYLLAKDHKIEDMKFGPEVEFFINSATYKDPSQFKGLYSYAVLRYIERCKSADLKPDKEEIKKLRSLDPCVALIYAIQDNPILADFFYITPHIDYISHIYHKFGITDGRVFAAEVRFAPNSFEKSAANISVFQDVLTKLSSEFGIKDNLISMDIQNNVSSPDIIYNGSNDNTKKLTRIAQSLSENLYTNIGKKNSSVYYHTDHGYIEDRVGNRVALKDFDWVSFFGDTIEYATKLEDEHIKPQQMYIKKTSADAQNIESKIIEKPDNENEVYQKTYSIETNETNIDKTLYNILTEAYWVDEKLDDDTAIKKMIIVNDGGLNYSRGLLNDLEVKQIIQNLYIDNKTNKIKAIDDKLSVRDILMSNESLDTIKFNVNEQPLIYNKTNNQLPHKKIPDQSTEFDKLDKENNFESNIKNIDETLLPNLMFEHQNFLKNNKDLHIKNDEYLDKDVKLIIEEVQKKREKQETKEINLLMRMFIAICYYDNNGFDDSDYNYQQTFWRILEIIEVFSKQGQENHNMVCSYLDKLLDIFDKTESPIKKNDILDSLSKISAGKKLITSYMKKKSTHRNNELCSRPRSAGSFCSLEERKIKQPTAEKPPAIISD